MTGRSTLSRKLTVQCPISLLLGRRNVIELLQLSEQLASGPRIPALQSKAAVTADAKFRQLPLVKPHQRQLAALHPPAEIHYQFTLLFHSLGGVTVTEKRRYKSLM
jgi:hypothetical protein